MSNKLSQGTESGQAMVYEIKVAGHLGDQWTEWFGGLAIRLEENGDTLLTGPVVDQAALHGLLRKVRDLGLPLLSVVRLETGPSTPLPERAREPRGTGATDTPDAGEQIEAGE